MDILAVKFNGISADRTEKVKVDEIDVNISIDALEPQKGGAAFVRFTYTLDYRPDVGRLALSGYVVVRDTQKEMAKVAGHWKKNRRLPEDLERALTNMISASSTISSVFAGHVLDLMPPFVPPVASR